MLSDERPGSGAAAAAEHLATIFEHHVWATLALIDHCAELTAQDLELSTPGGFGSVRATLSHLVRADARYQQRLFGEELLPPPAGQPDVAALRLEMERQATRWQEVLERLDALDVTVPAEPEETPPYPRVEHAAGLILTQAIHHGNEHRGHVCSILGAHGLRVPDLSGWEYVRVVQTSTRPTRTGMKSSS